MCPVLAVTKNTHCRYRPIHDDSSCIFHLQSIFDEHERFYVTLSGSTLERTHEIHLLDEDPRCNRKSDQLAHKDQLSIGPIAVTLAMILWFGAGIIESWIFYVVGTSSSGTSNAIRKAQVCPTSLALSTMAPPNIMPYMILLDLSLVLIHASCILLPQFLS